MNFIEQEELFKDKHIAITGGVGSIGSEIMGGLLKFQPRKITIIDNNETGIFYSKLYSPSEIIDHEVADVKEFDSIEPLLRGVDIVFHAAAMKHVTVCEESPFEAIKTNVLGTKNVIEACIKNEVDKMILISTDKAANPLNAMGATKLLAEKMVGAIATSKKRNNTKFGIIRFGNVLYSRGSVLEIWNRQLKENREIHLTNGEMTRFFMSLPQCVDLIFTATKLAKEGEIFVLKMPSFKMEDLAHAFLQLKGVPVDRIKVIGVKRGEKIHEELLLEPENIILENEKLFVSFPSYVSEERIHELMSNGFKETKTRHISSENREFILNPEEIKKILSDEKKLLGD